MRQSRRFTTLVILLTICAWLVIPASPTCAATSGDLLALIRHARGDRIPSSAFLARIAERRADEITVDYSHDTNGARDPLDGLRWGEILAWNSYPENLTEATAVAQWLDSPGHRGILLGRWSHVGVGVANVDHRHFYAVIFATLPAERSERPVPTLPPTDTVCG